MTDAVPDQSPSATDVERVPCRGCTRACPNYESCDGKPWRQPAEQRAQF